MLVSSQLRTSHMFSTIPRWRLNPRHSRRNLGENKNEIVVCLSLRNNYDDKNKTALCSCDFSHLLEFGQKGNTWYTGSTLNYFENRLVKSTDIYFRVWVYMSTYISVQACMCVQKYIIDKSNEWGCPRGVMVNVIDLGIVVSEFELQSRCYVHFGWSINPYIVPAMD